MKKIGIMFSLLLGAMVLGVVISLNFIPSDDIVLPPNNGVKTESSNEENEPVSGDDEKEIESNENDQNEEEEPVVSVSNDTENSGSDEIVTESTSPSTEKGGPIVTVPDNVLSDSEAHQLVVEKFNELGSILFHYISQTNFDEPVIPYDSFQHEVLAVVTANYEPTVKEAYDDSCRNCDTIPYNHDISAGDRLNVYENSEEAISLSVRSTATDLTPAVPIDIKLIKIDGTWKINDISINFDQWN